MTDRWRPPVPAVRGYSVVALDNPKNQLNVGSAMRAAHCFGAALMAVSGRRLKHWQAPDTAKAWRHLPLIWTDDLQSALPFDVFGQEDGTLDERVLSWCRDVVYIPTDNCLNLAACVNVVLYDRAAKSCERAKRREAREAPVPKSSVYEPLRRPDRLDVEPSEPERE